MVRNEDSGPMQRNTKVQKSKFMVYAKSQNNFFIKGYGQ